MILSELSKAGKECMGCGVCAEKCPDAALRMEINDEGFITVLADAEKCSACGKCAEICPQLNYTRENSQKPECYAAISEMNMRMKSTAGGAFPVFAEYILNKGGSVCGVTFNSAKMRAEYRIINKTNDIPLLQGAKYTQAALGTVFSDIKKLLGDGTAVLFCGTPCHVAALYNYLGEHSENLYTIDFVCHGVSTPLLTDAMTDYINSGSVNKVKYIDFSSKKKGFDPEKSLIVFDNDSSVVNEEFSAYHNSCLSLRKSCYDCRFALFPRAADVTLGIFYGVEQFNPDLLDDNGTSIVLTNNGKGKQLYAAVSGQFHIEAKVPLRFAVSNNRFFDKYLDDPKRERFFRFLKEKDYKTLNKYVKQNYYDVVIAANWSSSNYGAHITHFALYKYLTDRGFEVLMLEKPNVQPWPPLPVPELFRECPYPAYDLSPLYNSYEEMYNVNSIPHTFIAGSDQIWNPALFGHSMDFYTLGFADDDKVKISYASSFGSETQFDNYFKDIFTENLSKFNALSVRSEEDSELIRNELNVRAAAVMDPVFLNDVSVYDELTEKSAAKMFAPFVFAYVSWPEEHTEKMILDFADEKNEMLVSVKEALMMNNVDKKLWSVPTISNAGVEDWLYYIKNADYVFTDSYYGVCMAIIFRKNFTCVINEKLTGYTMIYALLEKLGLSSRIVNNPLNCYKEQKLDAEMFSPVDYSVLENKLQMLIDTSKAWLAEAMSELESNLAYEKAQKGKALITDTDNTDDQDARDKADNADGTDGTDKTNNNEPPDNIENPDYNENTDYNENVDIPDI